MNIVIDENIALAEEAFSGFGSVRLMPGREITNNVLIDADALIIRSVTNVDEELLRNTRVKFVGTATIGWDHVDTNYLKSRNIFFTSAQGCNSDAVTEYVFSALFSIAADYGFSLPGKKIGIIGAGNIGSRVAAIASSLGMQVLLNDPPLARQTGSNKYVPLQELFECDVLTLHVPLNVSGIDKTVHLLNLDNLRMFKDNLILINSSRGPVISNKDLIDAVKEKKLVTVLDVWENEPAVDKSLLQLTKLASPHVAGYSVEGKINGTRIIFNELSNFAGIPVKWPEPEGQPIINLNSDLTGTFEEKVYSFISQVYNIKNDDSNMRVMLESDEKQIPAYFDLLRKNYHLRREFFNYSVTPTKDTFLNKALSVLRFKL